MALYDIKEIVREARLLIDENEDNTALITEADEVANDTDAITEAMVLQSVDTVHRLAPIWRVAEISTEISLPLTKYMRGKAGELPNDFLRMVYAVAEDWCISVYIPIDQDSEQYQMQSSKFAGIRGSAERPVVAIVPGPEASGLRLEVYTTEKDSIKLNYVKRAAIISTKNDATETVTNKVEIASNCKKAVLYFVAKYYMVNIGEPERARHYESVAAELLGLSTGDTSTE